MNFHPPPRSGRGCILKPIAPAQRDQGREADECRGNDVIARRQFRASDVDERLGEAVGAPGFAVCGVAGLHRLDATNKPAAPLTATDAAKQPTLCDPLDPSRDLNLRARSYLHANCGHCHRFGGGGSVDLELHAFTDLEKTKAVDVPPGTSWEEAAARGWVDRHFPALVAAHGLRVEVVNFRRWLDERGTG